MQTTRGRSEQERKESVEKSDQIQGTRGKVSCVAWAGILTESMRSLCGLHDPQDPGRAQLAPCSLFLAYHAILPLSLSVFNQRWHKTLSCCSSSCYFPSTCRDVASHWWLPQGPVGRRCATELFSPCPMVRFICFLPTQSHHRCWRALLWHWGEHSQIFQFLCH